MAAIPLEVAVGVTAHGVGVFSRVQAAIATVGGTARQQAAAGIKQMGDELLKVVAGAGPVRAGLVGIVTGMDQLAAGAGTATPEAFAKLETALAQEQRRIIEVAAAHMGLNDVLLNAKAIRGMLTAEEGQYVTVLAALQKVIGRLRREVEAEDRAARRSIATKRRGVGAVEAMSSAARGLLTGLSILQGDLKGTLTGIVRLRYGVAAISIPLAIMTATVGGLAKAITVTGNAVEKMRSRLSHMSRTAQETVDVWKSVVHWSILTGRATSDVADATRIMREEGIAFGDMAQAVYSLAAARQIEAAEAAEILASAVGQEESALESLRDVGVQVDTDLLDLTDRRAVMEAAALAVMERYPNAWQNMAKSGSGAWERIKTSAAAAWSTIAFPVWEQIGVPFLNVLADLATGLAKFTTSLWNSEEVANEWNEIIGLARGLLAEYSGELGLLTKHLKLKVVDALKAFLTIVRLTVRGLGFLLEVMRGLWKVNRILASSLKPVIDLFRRLTGGLKALPWEQSLADAKKWSFDFPDIIWTALEAILMAFKYGPLAGLGIVLANLLGDAIIEMLPFREEVKAALHRVFDWTMLGAIIGGFFGPLGFAIGIAAGALIGLLDEKLGLPIRSWIEHDLLGAILYGSAGAILGLVLTGGNPFGAVVGFIIGEIVGLLVYYRKELGNFFLVIENDLSIFFTRLVSNFAGFMASIWGPVLGKQWAEMRSQADARIKELLAEQGLARRALERVVSERGERAALAGTAGVERALAGRYVTPEGRARAVGMLGTAAAALRTGETVVNVDVSGNYILDDATASALADKIGKQIMEKMARRYGPTGAW